MPYMFLINQFRFVFMQYLINVSDIRENICSFRVCFFLIFNIATAAAAVATERDVLGFDNGFCAGIGTVYRLL